MAIPQERLGTWPDGGIELVHELGHAFEDALEELDPQVFDSYETARDGHRQRMGEGKGTFPSDYASLSPGEMASESFAYNFPGHPEKVRGKDAPWDRIFQEFLVQGAGLGAPCLRPGEAPPPPVGSGGGSAR